MNPTAPQPARRDWFAPALIGVGMLALALRIAFLGSESLWNDELSTLAFTSKGPLQTISATAADTGLPVYFVLQSLLNLVVGPSEVSLRLVSAVAGTLLVVVVGMIGRRMYGSAAGVLAAGAAAVGYRAIYFSQEARSNMLGALMAALVALALLRALDRRRTRDFVWLGLAALGAAYTHVFAIASVAGIVLGVLLRPRVLRRLGWRFAAALGGAFVLWLPWAFVLVRQTQRVAALEASGGWILTPPASFTIALGEAVGDYAPWGGNHPLGIVMWGFLLVVGAFLASDWRSANEVGAAPVVEGGAFELTHADRTSILLAWVGMVVVGGLLVSRLVLPIYDWRMALMAAPAMYLLVGYGVTRLWRPAAVAIVLAILLAGASSLPRYYRTLEKERWRDVTQVLVERDAQRDGVFAYPRFILKNLDGYARIIGESQGFDGVPIDRSADPTAVLHRVEFNRHAADGSFWLVESHVPYVTDRRSTLDIGLLKSGWRVAEEHTYDDIVVRHYVSTRPRGATR